MGAVIRRRKIATTPLNPWEGNIIVKELQLIGTYGLKNKSELWTMLTLVKKDKEQARKLLITTDKELFKVEGRSLLNRLSRLGLIEGVDFNDDEIITLKLREVLNLEINNYLDRRLQTIVSKNAIARNIHHSRNLITQKQITIEGKVVNKPGMLVRIENEPYVEINPNSVTAGKKKGRYHKKDKKE